MMENNSDPFLEILSISDSEAAIITHVCTNYDELVTQAEGENNEEKLINMILSQNLSDKATAALSLSLGGIITLNSFMELQKPTSLEDLLKILV